MNKVYDASRADEAPINALPDDVLKLIFEEAYEHRLNQSCQCGYATVPTHVSCRWRRLATSLPYLWRYIHVTPSMDMLKLYLDRTELLPLFIRCSGTETDEDEQPPEPEGVTTRHMPCLESLLADYADRIQLLDISSCYGHVLAQLLYTMQQRSLPVLSYLSISNQNLDPEDDMEADLRFQLCYPNLKDLHLLALPVEYSSSSFDSLRSLCITHCNISILDLHALSNAAPQLSSLTLSSVGSVIGINNIIPFPSLQSLTFIDEYFTVEKLGILDQMDAPILRRLCVDTFLDSRTNQPQPPRAFPSIRELCFRNTYMYAYSPTYDGNLFLYAPNAVHFELRNDRTKGSPVLRCLAENPAFLPLLHTVLVTGPRKLDCYTVLQDLVARQAQREGPLKELRLEREVIDEIGAELEEVGNGIIQIVLAD
ncbi:uncharacterized protein PHACADRAFT_172159 [Phanerochaete carnosa HHB-10118-sp]|uniref:Uncharacterized protein n=1 Tax=Phanerochaete carnosa (strain HHB-10118-sp) TaxID=650164 RepID=K5WBX1_PHACS|nr:uncharacterized protein PHACADRAFT_172159 [Phanerochaete carnosa HHB-10118-sp]EKM56479.1 hypothetical protein PHACADRAFT_172159 [Phanerochaete carnosa HHB-10118-sp]